MNLLPESTGVDGPELLPVKPHRLDLLPMVPTCTVLKVAHMGQSTIIARSFDRPELCRLCPRAQCDYTGGFCIVNVPRHVPAAECAAYSIVSDVALGLIGSRPRR